MKIKNSKYPLIVDISCVLLYEQVENNRNFEPVQLVTDEEDVERMIANIESEEKAEETEETEEAEEEEFIMADDKMSSESSESSTNSEHHARKESQTYKEVEVPERPLTLAEVLKKSDVFLHTNQQLLKERFIVTVNATCPNETDMKIKIHTFTMFNNLSPHGYVQIILKEGNLSDAFAMGIVYFIPSFNFFIKIYSIGIRKIKIYDEFVHRLKSNIGSRVDKGVFKNYQMRNKINSVAACHASNKIIRSLLDERTGLRLEFFFFFVFNKL